MRHHGLGSHGTYPIARALIVCASFGIQFSLIFSCYVLTHVCRKLKCIIVIYTFKTWSSITKSVCKCRDGVKGSIKKSQTQEKGKGSEGTVSFTFPFSIFLFTLSQCHLSYPLLLPGCCSY